MTIDDVIWKAEIGKYHDRQNGAPRFTELLVDMASTGLEYDRLLITEMMRGGKNELVQGLREMKGSKP